jgi:RND family efflux transporter MFP subunit
MFKKTKQEALKSYNFSTVEQAFLPVPDFSSSTVAPASCRRWVEQAFLPVPDKGQTKMSDPPNGIIHYGWSLNYLTIIILFTFLLSACGEKIEPGTTQTGETRTVKVRTTVAQIIRQPYLYEAVGTIQARQGSTLSSKLMGTVKTVRVAEGDTVKQGDILVVLEQIQVDAGLRQAQAALEEARRAQSAAMSGRDAARASADLARATFERYQRLIKQDSASRQEFDEVKSRHQEAQAALASAESMLKAAEGRAAQVEAAMDSARATKDDAEIRAPYDGIITSKKVQAGDLAAPGTPLLAIEGKSGYRVDLILPETYLRAVSSGQKLNVTIPNLQDAAAGGVVQTVIPTTDTASRTFLVKVDLPDGLNLHSGMFARVAVPVGDEGMMRVPQTAIISQGQLTGLFKADEQNTARFRLVRTGRTFGDEVEILSGLKEGDRFVVSLVPGLVNGVKIEEAP